MRLAKLTVVLGALGFGVACSDNGTNPGPGACGPAGSTTALRGQNITGLNLLTANPSTLGPFDAVTVAASTITSCVDLAGDSATYIAVPQFATGAGGNTAVAYEIGAAQGGTLARVVSLTQSGAAGSPALPPQLRLDRKLRELEHTLAPGAPAALREWSLSLDRVAAASAPTLGSTRDFQVLASLDTAVFDTVTATLRYVGTNILIYVDNNAPSALDGGFTDAQLATFGRVFDQDLYGIDVRTFGPPSDIDGNAHVIVLLTPVVNTLTKPAECDTLGFVAGFFYGLDLIPTRPNSNKGEIFYALVPDSSGQFSCKHSLSDVERITPATFIHEFQHMISWNQHVIVRGGSEEALWLNEGLSHIAEEMGSRYYESRLQPPPGRLFPDSAEGFIIGDLINSYDYLLDPSQWSITKFIQGGRLQERGGAWLFLRWLGDQKDSTIYRKLEQTSLTGIANVEAQAGEKFPALFGAFSLALYTDSLPGVSRSAIPERYRFKSRNLRLLYQALYNATTDRSRFPRPFPLPLTTVNAPGAQSSSMVPGTAEFFRLQLPKDGVRETLHFTPGAGGNGTFDPVLNAQVTLFRCPSAAVCQ
jgi:hypothetical protein